MNVYRFISIALPAALFVGGSLMRADTIGGPGSSCGSCAGAAYTLTYSGSPILSTATTQTFQITLDINDISYTGGGSFLKAVAINVAPPPKIVSDSLVSAPGRFSGVSGTGLSDTGCGTNGSGFICTQASGNGPSVSLSPFDFVFDVEVKTGTLLTGLDAASIKALYVNSDGTKVGPLLSENITLQDAPSVPEPSSALLLGSGLAGGLLLLHKRRKSLV